MDFPRAANAALASLTIAAALSPALGQPLTSEPAPAARPAAAAVIDVFAADATGAPVQGLRAADFEILKDGTPVSVTGVIGPGRSRGAHVPSSDPRGPEILVVVFVDTLTTPPQQRAALLAGTDSRADDFAWGAGVRVMVASGGDTVTIRQPFTVDPRVVLQALEGIGSRGEDFPAQGQEAGQTPASPADLGSFVESLGGLPGRTALLYVGGSLPPRPSGAGVGAAADPARALADTANAAGVTAYCVETAAGGRSERGTVPQRSRDAAAGATAEPGAGTVDSLRPLVSATGGLAVVPSAGISGAIAAVVRDLRGAYSVSFVAPSRGDGAMPQVRVSVRRAGVSARARSAVFDRNDDATMAGRTLAALSFGVADNPLGVQVSVTTEPKPGEGAQLATVLVSVPLGNLAFAARTVSHDCDLGLWLAARDSDGHVIRAPKAKFQVSVPNDRLLTALNQTASYTFKIPLKLGGGAFAVTVRDEIAMQAATELTTLAPGTVRGPGVKP